MEPALPPPAPSAPGWSPPLRPPTLRFRSSRPRQSCDRGRGSMSWTERVSGPGRRAHSRGAQLGRAACHRAPGGQEGHGLALEHCDLCVRQKHGGVLGGGRSAYKVSPSFCGYESVAPVNFLEGCWGLSALSLFRCVKRWIPPPQFAHQVGPRRFPAPHRSPPPEGDAFEPKCPEARVSMQGKRSCCGRASPPLCQGRRAPQTC